MDIKQQPIGASTGNWAADCQLGRGTAEAVIRDCADDPANYPKFLVICRDMTAHGRWGGVEVGFMQRVAELAVSGLDASK